MADFDASRLGNGPISGRPRVFVSSTIYDFHDMRSALKVWLEQMGAEVRMSEFTDFERPPDLGTLNSCFAAIADCHYYVLLVGMRRGSWLNPDQRVSVTQQEFRTAMALAAEGKITPVVFVRSEVEAALRFGRKRRPRGQQSAPKLQDSDFTRAFLDEIRASKFGPAVVTGRADTLWHYMFSDFSELLPALRVNLHLHRSVRRHALLANLRWELIENIAALCIRHKGRPLAHTDGLVSVRREVDLTKDRVMGWIDLPRRSAVRVAMVWMFGLVGERMRSQALGEAILAGEFLQFDRMSGGMAGEPMYVAMQRLNARIDDYRRQCATARQEFVRGIEVSEAVRRRDATVPVRGYDLATIFGICDTADDILRLSIALLRYIQGDSPDFEMPRLNPMSPIRDVNEELEAEQASHADVERWAREGRLWGWVAVETDDDRRDYEALLEQYPFIREAMEREAAEVVAEFERRRERDGPDVALAWLRDRLGKGRQNAAGSSDNPDR